jgi:hypothetical protein
VKCITAIAIIEQQAGNDLIIVSPKSGLILYRFLHVSLASRPPQLLNVRQSKLAIRSAVIGASLARPL